MLGKSENKGMVDKMKKLFDETNIEKFPNDGWSGKNEHNKSKFKDKTYGMASNDHDGRTKWPDKLDEDKRHAVNRKKSDGLQERVSDQTNRRDQKIADAFTASNRQTHGIMRFTSTELQKASEIRNIENSILDEMEKDKKCHTLELHVGHTNEELMRRANQEDSDVTSFTDKSTAIKALQNSMCYHANTIAKWLNHPYAKPRIFLSMNHEYGVGKGVWKWKKKVHYNLKKTMLVLEQDLNSQLGFKIITFYPIP